ncbi:hypothetical protein C5167_011751, partial [Papaver somniferum]
KKLGALKKSCADSILNTTRATVGLRSKSGLLTTHFVAFHDQESLMGKRSNQSIGKWPAWELLSLSRQKKQESTKGGGGLEDCKFPFATLHIISSLGSRIRNNASKQEKTFKGSLSLPFSNMGLLLKH